MKLIRVYCHSEREEMVSAYNLAIHPDLLAAYEELGLIDIKSGCISIDDLRRLQRILRLKENCGVNTIGASIIVDLLDRIEKLQDEIERLRRK